MINKYFLTVINNFKYLFIEFFNRKLNLFYLIFFNLVLLNFNNELSSKKL